MSKIAFSDKSDLIVNSANEVNKVTAANLNEIKASVNSLYDSKGWIRYVDTVHTVSNKQSLTSSIDNVIPIVDANPLSTYKPLIIGNANLWTGNKITPYTIGDIYIVRLDFEASIDNNQGFFDLKVDIDGSVGIVFSSINNFPKGTNVPHIFSYTFMIYTLDTFLENGGEIRINPSNTMLIWNKSILITRLFGNELFE